MSTSGAHGVLSRGGWAQAQFKTGKKWEWNFGYGIDDPSARNLAVGSRYRNGNIFASLIESLTRNFQWSLEYRRLLTYFRDQAALTGRADQFTLSTAYLF